MKKIDIIFFVALLLSICGGAVNAHSQACIVYAPNGMSCDQPGEPQAGGCAGTGYISCPSFCCPVPVISPGNAPCNTGYILSTNGVCTACIVGSTCSSSSTTPASYGSAFVNQSSTTKTTDPVNIATGEDYFSSTDFSLNSQGPKLALIRKYRSFSTFIGLFGYGWRTDYDVNLSVDSAGNVIVFDNDGTESFFANYSGSFIPSPGNYSSIKMNPDNTYTITDKHGIATHYDINGRFLTRTDRNGNQLSFVYNPSVVGGSYIQDASGRQIKLYFNSQNYISSAVDPSGKTYQYGYDLNGNLVSITDPTGAVTTYNYFTSTPTLVPIGAIQLGTGAILNNNPVIHQITQFTNSNGHSTFYTYDSQGRATSTYQANNVNKTTLNYEDNNTTVVTDSLGNSSTYVFNNYGLLLSRKDPLGNVTQEVWDNNMNLLSKTDARGNVTNYDYDQFGDLLQIVDPSGNTTTLSFTPNFNLISTKTDALGNVTKYAYDNNGNLTGITNALKNTHTFVYDQFGNIISASDSRGNKTIFTYDAFGHLIQKTDALGNSTNFSYE